MSEQPAGPLIDALGVTLDLDPNQQLTDVLVIGKVADFGTSNTVLIMARSDGLDWIAQLGLLHAALQVADNDPPLSAD